MPLDDQLGRWTQRAAHVRDTLNPVLSAWPDDDRRVLPSTLAGLKVILGDELRPGMADIPPEGSALREAVDAFITALGEFMALTTVPSTNAEFRALLAGVRDTAQTTHLALSADDQLAVQTVEEIIAEFAQEYRTSLILALTANYALSQNVIRWQESKASNPTTGDHLDLATMTFVADSGARTISMSTLAAASTSDPIVSTPMNFTASMQTLKTGGTPPPIYRMAYTQWFANINAAWEDTYRPRLAAAHVSDDAGKAWTKNDIRSEFFNEIRLIRNDISHKRGVCIDSSKNTIINWVQLGELIAPTPQQMLDLLDQFPHDELRRTPTRSVSNSSSPLPYGFPNDWVDKVRTHIEAVEPSRKKRPALLQQLIDAWMTTTAE